MRYLLELGPTIWSVNKQSDYPFIRSLNHHSFRKCLLLIVPVPE